MGNEHGEWIMRGRDELHDVRQAEEYIMQAGFLPLFANHIPGFSLEEHTNGENWWTGDAGKDPWEWRMQIAASHRIAYGKFFEGKAGFITLEWLPAFVNYRRGGLDFDEKWDMGEAQFREKKIMDRFDGERAIPTYILKKEAGFDKNGEKNFDGVLSLLQYELYLVMSDFCRKKDRWGREYGWSIAMMSRPEDLWGYEAVTAAYDEPLEKSYRAITGHLKKLYPGCDEKEIIRLIGKPPEP